MESPQVEERNRGLAMYGGTAVGGQQEFCASKRYGHLIKRYWVN
ncbi:hypothetical protein [Pedobacter chitinilyticus]|nr:hypothetical protein [Pedobacter chitinilyticus]